MRPVAAKTGRERGFTLFELAIVVIIVGVLAGVLLLRAQQYREEAQLQSVRQTIGLLRVAMELRVLKAGGSSRIVAMRRMTEENPFDWLEQKPENYVGEYYSPDLKEIPTGNWVFDRRDKTLVFLLNSDKTFSFNASNFLKFKVEFTQARVPGEKHGPAEVPTGLVIAQLHDQSAETSD